MISLKGVLSCLYYLQGKRRLHTKTMGWKRWEGEGAVGCKGYIIAECTKVKCSWEDMGLGKIGSWVSLIVRILKHLQGQKRMLQQERHAVFIGKSAHPRISAKLE